jgi:dynein heavy chain, axonemal
MQVGVGGSGRQSLTRLAAFICGLQALTIEVGQAYGVAEWRSDLRVILREAGEKGRPCVFLLSDSQIKYESFLEDINSILNTGEVRLPYPRPDSKEECFSVLSLLLAGDEGERIEDHVALNCVFCPLEDQG